MRYKEEYFDCYNCTVVYDNRGIIREEEISEISFNCLKNNTFELIEENQDIDIQSIEEQGYDEFTSLEVYKRIQELIQAIKQLDRQINNN